MALKKRWATNAAERRAYGERMRAIEAQTTNVPNGYNICCTGDCVVGDCITFFNPNKGAERMFGKVIKDSYGAEKQQHTFTIELDNGEDIRIKGRNLYKFGVYRKEWENEELRRAAAEEKHERGNAAREAAAKRKAAKKEDDGLLRWKDGSIMEEDNY